LRKKHTKKKKERVIKKSRKTRTANGNSKNSVDDKSEIKYLKEWWERKKKENKEFIEAIKHGDYNKVKSLFSHSNKKEVLCEVNTKVQNDWRALHIACYKGHFKIVNFLIYKHADIEARTKSNLTPLMIAAQRGQAEIC